MSGLNSSFSGISVRGARGSSIDRGRGVRGGRGIFYPSLSGYQRPNFYDEDGRTTARGDRSWTDRNGSATNDSDWNGTSSTTSPSPRKDFLMRSTSSGESWRRTRLDEEGGSSNINGEGWRGSGGSNSMYKWRKYFNNNKNNNILYK